MNDQLKKEQPLLYSTIIESLKEQKKVQHAYLIETNFIENKEQYILEFVENLFLMKLNTDILSKEKLHQYLIENHYPDLQILKPTGNIIKKEELLSIKENFQTKSIYDGYQIYIIYDAEKLNSSSANTILKFLEEPEENIIAILVTNNRYQVLDTILSRCQILSLQNNRNNKIQLSPETSTFLDMIIDRKNKNLMLSFKTIFEELFQNKECTIQILSELNNFFAQILRNNYNIEESNESSDYKQYQIYFKEEEVLKILFITENKKKELEYNVNLKMWIDSFLLQLMEV